MNKRIMLIIGFLMILTGSLLIQKRSYDAQLELRKLNFDETIDLYKNRLKVTAKVIRILRAQVEAPKNESWLFSSDKDQFIVYGWYYPTDYPKIHGYFEYFYIDPDYKSVSLLDCIKLKPDYVKYFLVLPNEGEVIIWTKKVII